MLLVLTGPDWTSRQYSADVQLAIPLTDEGFERTAAARAPI